MDPNIIYDDEWDIASKSIPPATPDDSDKEN